jgi:hypothetical protein
MNDYNERLRRGFNIYQAAHGDDTPLEFDSSDLEKMTPPTPSTEDAPDVPTTNDIPDLTGDRVNILPVVVFVLSTEDYARLCAGDEN